MSFTTETGELSPIRSTPDAMLRAPVGFASPLWGMFTGVALTGVAWWWATQWMRQPVAEGLIKGMADTVEAAPALVEPTLETVIEPVLETLIKPEAPTLAVGGESAPISPVALVAEEPAPVELAPPEEPMALAPMEEHVTPEPAQAPVMMEAVAAEIFEPPPVSADPPELKKPRAPRALKVSAPAVDQVSVEEPSTMQAAGESPEPAPATDEAPKARRAYKPRTPRGRHRRQARKRLT